MELSLNIKIWFACFLALVFAATLIWRREKDGWALLFLTLGGFCFYLMAAQLYPFLNLWDEQYHALVAKNCMTHPFQPMLYTEAILPDHDYNHWICAHIWLHKQPLFIWQIALSFKIFGVSELALRLPSVLMCTLLVPLNYRIAQLLTQRRDIAFFTALSTAASWFLLCLTSGVIHTDHNDVCFLFYVTASVWAFVEYAHRGSAAWQWALLIGLFSGCAIMTKWLVGLLVYLVWGCYLLAEKGFRFREWKWGHLMAALAITLLIVLPWQIYCLHQFPEIARQELLFNFQHASTGIELHTGPWNFYLIILPMHFFGRGPHYTDIHPVWNFNTIICYAVLAIGFVLAIRALRSKSQRITFIATTLFVFLFFSFAKTKMPAFTFVISFVGFLSIATLLAGICRLLSRIIHSHAVLTVIMACLCTAYALYSSNYPNFYRETDRMFFQLCTENKKQFEEWGKKIPEKGLIFNVMTPSYPYGDYTSCIPATFYSGRECYFDKPTPETLKALQEQGRTVAVVRNPWIEDYMEQDSTIIKLEMK